MVLTKVVENVVHVHYGPGPTTIAVERAPRSDEVATAIHFVCEVNLVKNQCQYRPLGGAGTVTYRSSRKGEDTQWPVSGPWVFGWDRLHNTRCGIVTQKCLEDRVGLKDTASHLQTTFRVGWINRKSWRTVLYPPTSAWFLISPSTYSRQMIG